MSIIYLISVLLLLSTFILVKKSDKKINIVSFACISVVSLLCFNAFICYVLTIFRIPTELWVLATINLLISFLLLIPIYKKKQIQKYIFNKIDLLYISLILIVVLIVSYINFGIPFNIKYETSDPSLHYLTSVIFAESDSLLANDASDPIYQSSLRVRKIASYVNSGLLMKCFCNELDPIECYNVFVIFGIVTWFLTGATLYAAFTNFAKKKEHFLWAFFVSLICMLGYPLNSFLFGFEYMSMGLLIICAILDLIYYYDKEILSFKYFVTLMGLLNFGLFSSYYMFVPFVYLALGIYFYIRNYNKTKKLISKEIIGIWVITLIIPFILGFIYYLAPNTYAKLINKTNDFSIFYRSVSLILIILGIYYYIKKHRKTKKIISNRTKIIVVAIIFLILISTFVYIYYLEPTIYNDLIKDIKKFSAYAKHIINAEFAKDGYIYINLYSNMLLLLPLTLYLFIKKGSLKDNKFIALLLIFCIAFIAILFAGYKKGSVSIYYLSKNYFALWIILMYCNYKALILLSERGNDLPWLFLGAYIFMMIICTIFSDVKMVDDALVNEDEKVFYVMEIFGSNKTMLLKEPEKLSQDEIEILMYARKNLDYNSKIEVVSEGIQYYWSYVLLRYCNYEPVLNRVNYGQYKLNLKVYYLFNKINNVDYMIYLNRSQKYDELKNILFLNSEIIYENEAGGILKYYR